MDCFCAAFRQPYHIRPAQRVKRGSSASSKLCVLEAVREARELGWRASDRASSVCVLHVWGLSENVKIENVRI